MLAQFYSSLSEISRNFLPTNIFTSISKENNRIATIALAVISTLATLLVISRCFKIYKLDSTSSAIPPHINPQKPTKKQSFPPLKQSSPPLPEPISTATPKIKSDEKYAELIANELPEEYDLDLDMAIELQKEFDKEQELKKKEKTILEIAAKPQPVTIAPFAQPKISPVFPEVVKQKPTTVPDIIPAYSLNIAKLTTLTHAAETTHFQKLSKQQASAILDIEKTLRKRPAVQGRLFAYDSILTLHENGVPARLSAFSNDELVKQTRFILYTISQETNLNKQKELLLELAVCVEDCLPVAQGRISLMYMRLASVGKGLDKQVEQFLSGYKDRIVDQIINQLFPDMQKPEYAKKYHAQPSKQFPHMKTGFLALVGKELGLNAIGAMEDPNKNTIDAALKKGEFKKLFQQLVSMQEIVKEFIIDVNGRNGQIDLDDLGNWCKPENLGEEAYNVFYDEEFQYPSYSPQYDPKKNGFAPYLTEKSAYLILEKLGYIHKI